MRWLLHACVLVFIVHWRLTTNDILVALCSIFQFAEYIKMFKTITAIRFMNVRNVIPAEINRQIKNVNSVNAMGEKVGKNVSIFIDDLVRKVMKNPREQMFHNGKVSIHKLHELFCK